MKGLIHERDWHDVKERLMEKFPHLTEEDFKAENDDELLVHLSQKTGKSKGELREIIRKI